MARKPRTLAPGEGWVGRRVFVKKHNFQGFAGTIIRMSDGKHLSFWVKSEDDESEHLVYAQSVTILE